MIKNHNISAPLYSSTYLKQGKAHFKILISGSMSLAIPSKTMILVSSVANYPSNFMWFLRMVAIMFWKRVIPFNSLQVLPLSIPKTYYNYFLQVSNFLPVILWPQQLDKLQIISAHQFPLHSMTALMKFTNAFLSLSYNLITMPASSRFMMIFSFSLRINFLTAIYSSTYSRQSRFRDYESTVSAFSRQDITQARSLKKSRTSVKKLQDWSLIQMKILPPWQSAWIKLFFINISKNASEPSLAMTLFKGCLLSQKQVTGCPSTKDSINTISLVLSQMGEGKFTSFLYLNISLKVFKFLISKVKSICSIKVFLSEEQLTGISQDGEIKDARQLKKKRMFISLSMYLATSGCLTFTATFLPLQIARQTWLTDPDAIGSGSNSSKISSIFFPQDSLKYFLVVSSE